MHPVARDIKEHVENKFWRALGVKTMNVEARVIELMAANDIILSEIKNLKEKMEFMKHFKRATESNLNEFATGINDLSRKINKLKGNEDEDCQVCGEMRRDDEDFSQNLQMIKDHVFQIEKDIKRCLRVMGARDD